MVQYGYWDDLQTIEHIIRLLKNNSIIAGTSDTIIGLLALVSKEGKEGLDAIKIRNEKPYIVLVGDLEKAAYFSDAIYDKRFERLCETFWPGPLTVIVPAKKNIDSYAVSLHGTIALRIPCHAGLQRILSEVKGLFSTSANIAQQPYPKKISDISEDILKKISFIIQDHQEYIAEKPSTIIDCTGSLPFIIREGLISISEIEKVIPQNKQK